jgi:hypothetical protein
MRDEGQRSGAVVGFGNHPLRLMPTGGRPATWPRLAIIASALLAPLTAVAAEEKPALPRPMPVIAAGTVVDDPDRDRWNRIVLLATPRLASGDTADVSDAIRDAVARFTFVVLATVQPLDTTAAESKTPRYELVEVGIGHCMQVNGRLTVVAPDAGTEGVSLDFLNRQVLNAKHKSLAEIECVGSHRTAVAFDAPSLMLRGEDHEDLVVRHAVRIDPQSGTCTTCAWLMTSNEEGGLEPVEEPLRIIDGGTREERPIHVDGQLFTFGLPTKRAFAVEDLPPGRRVDWSTALRTAATAATYSDAAIDRLLAELDTAVASLRTLRSAER